MASKRYLRSLLQWHLLVLALMLGFCYVLVVQQWYLAAAVLLVLLAAAVYSLFKKISTTNSRLAVFFQRMFSGDSALRFPEVNQGLGTEKLNHELNKIAAKINQLEQARQREENLFKAVVQHLSVGVFLLDNHQHLHLSNPLAQEFLNVRSTADRAQLERRAPHFFRQLSALRENGKLLMEVNSQGETQKWQVQRRLLKQEGQSYELFLVSNLQAALENKESEVSEKLMHTLTHEIMNSISPLTSLSETLQLQLSGHDEDQNEVCLPRENFEDLQTTARIIRKRGHGLVEFVKRYSLLARLPRLKMEPIPGEKLLEELQLLMREELAKAGIDLHIQAESRHIRFRADKQLLLQVLINLVKNATEAYQPNDGGNITLKMAKGDGYNYISVVDEAGGVPAEIRKDIFLPFFSTKDKGSGIGLSLSRKIIQAHNGRLYLKSYQNGSELRIELPD